MSAPCPFCGRVHPARAQFCPETGKRLPTAAARKPQAAEIQQKGRNRHCPHCGQQHASEALFCPESGKPLPRDPADGSPSPNPLFIAAAVIVLVAVVLLWPRDDPSPYRPGTPVASATRYRTAVPLQTPTRVAATRTRPAEIPTRTPTRIPARTSTPAPPLGSWRACAGTYYSRLHVGDTAYVSYDPPLPNRVRADANPSAQILGRAEPGDRLEILDGPSCSNKWVWWYVRVKGTKLKGWTSEGDSSGYWLVPEK